jgi:HD-GYP domain-containing protein (c-di-GMP phosphodiesterase class II)
VRSSDVRLAEPLAALSLAGDLGMGLGLEHAIRVTYVAGRLAGALGLGAEERSNVFYVSLLHGIGCTADAHDLARVFATDEIALKAAGAVLDQEDRVAGLRYVLARAGSAGPVARRPIAAAQALLRGSAAFADGLRAHCEVGDLLASSVGVPAAARAGLLTLFDRWDGSGVTGSTGADIPIAARVFHVAKIATAHFDKSGPGAAFAAVRSGAGRGLEPGLTEAFLDLATSEPVLAVLAEPDLGNRTLDLEPVECRLVLEPDREPALFEAIADMADLKSPAFIGHSRAVADLVIAAGRRLGFGDADVAGLRRAALAHDLGRASVPNMILDKPRALTPAEWETIRLHAYHTERVLLRSEILAPSATTAGLHHERLDGSGYHRGVRAASLPPAARLLAAADAWQALGRARPHRPALDAPTAAALLRSEVRAGRLDGDAVEAVIASAEGRPLRLTGGGRLSEREVEVIRLLAAGLSTRDIAAKLSITQKTVRHHVEHIYDKLGVSTRAAAVVAAIGEGRLGEEPQRLIER